MIIIIITQVDHLTVGGLVLGGGLESTSHKHGMFHQVLLCNDNADADDADDADADLGYHLQLVTEYELVTANGECILASANENCDLFRVLPMSYGTFGFLTRITIRMVLSDFPEKLPTKL